jgi:hypothetical protein
MKYGTPNRADHGPRFMITQISGDEGEWCDGVGVTEGLGAGQD